MLYFCCIRMSNRIEALLQDLRSNDPVVRCGILGQLEKQPWNPSASGELRRLAADRGDSRLETILALLDHLASPATAPEGRFAEFARILQQPVTDVLQILLRLKGLPAADLPRAAELLRLRGLGGIPDAALPWIFRFFRDHGSAADAAILRPALKHPSPLITRAAFEALERLSPEDLRPSLVGFLLSPFRENRCLAVRLLQRWDPDEADRHLEAMLRDPDPGEREAALGLSLDFPFARVEPLLLRFLSFEEDLSLLRRAGEIIVANPPPNLPLELVELLEASTGRRQEILRKIVIDAINSLGRTTLDRGMAQDLISELQSSARQRREAFLLEQCRLTLSSGNPIHHPATLSRLRFLADHGLAEARELLASHPGASVSAVPAPPASRPLSAVDRASLLDDLAARLFSVRAERRFDGLLEAATREFPAVRDLLLKLAERESDTDCRRFLRRLLETHLGQEAVNRLFVAADAAETNGEPPEKREPESPPGYVWADIAAIRFAAEPVFCAPTSSFTADEATDLRSADPTIRFLGLRAFAAADWDETLGDTVRGQLADLADPVERFLLEFAFNFRKRRLQRPGREEVPPVVRLERSLSGPEPDFAEAALLLEGLSLREAELAMPRLRRLPWPSWPDPHDVGSATLQPWRAARNDRFGQCNGAVGFLSRLFLFFQRHGGPEDTAAIERFCRHPDPRAALPAIDALEQLNPGELEPLLVSLLTSPSPGIRARAMALVARRDAPEAVKHFEAALFADSPVERHLALRFLPSLSFAAIEDLLIRFIEGEDDPRLLSLAADLIRANPSPRIPPKLVGPMGAASEAKQTILGNLVLEVAQSLSHAGLIAQPVEEYLTAITTEPPETLTQPEEEGSGPESTGQEHPRVPRPAATTETNDSPRRNHDPGSPEPSRQLPPYAFEIIRRIRQQQEAPSVGPHADDSKSSFRAGLAAWRESPKALVGIAIAIALLLALAFGIGYRPEPPSTGPDATPGNTGQPTETTLPPAP